MLPILLLALALVSFQSAEAQEKDNKSESPRVTACAPLQISPGTTSTLRLRGLQLDTAKELRFAPANSAIKSELKEKKKADLPTGLDAKTVGDTQLEVVLTLPADLGLVALTFQVNTAGGWTPERSLRVIGADAVLDEKEPNGGFRQAQAIERSKLLRGVIKEDKDVDVFTMEARAGERLEAHVFASAGASLLDPVLTFFDARGQLISASDDTAESRDPRVAFTAPSDGRYYVSVQDAHDRGGAFYAYELNWKAGP